MLLILLSLVLVAFGHSSYVPCFGIGAAAVGYACFWKAILSMFSNTRKRFWAFFLWYATVLAIHLSWLTSIQYMGMGILTVYLLVIILFSLQFGCLAFFFKNPLNITHCIALSSFWVISEWCRLFYIPGHWVPVGISLSSSSLAIQFAALFGVYGLSFWVMFVNAYALCAKKPAVWAALAMFPYLFGLIQQEYVKRYIPVEQTLSIALVQTGILPEQKDRIQGYAAQYIPPIVQWERIWEQLDASQKVDLIVLPEAAVSLSAYMPYYPIEMVEILWQYHFGKEALKDLPKTGERKVTNSYLAQSLANHFQAEVIIGLVDGRYNTAFCFHPGNYPEEKTEKRYLVPIGEYVPFSENKHVAQFFLDNFGVSDAFDVGTESKIFASHFPTAVSICVEETYSHFLRELRNRGAKLFVNVTNDVWFPTTRLPEHHFQLGQIRSAENGVFSLRSCNTGVTGVIDCCGNAVNTLPVSEKKVDILYANVPVKSFKTLYAWWGDGAILSLSAIGMIVGMCLRRK